MITKLNIKELQYCEELGIEKFKYLDQHKEYLISNYGRVYSLKTNRFLKHNTNSRGYPRVETIHTENGVRKRQQRFIHIEIVKHFGDVNLNSFDDVSENMIWPTIDHIDKDPTNFLQNNLEIVDFKENIKRRDTPLEELPKRASIDVDLAEIF